MARQSRSPVADYQRRADGAFQKAAKMGELHEVMSGRPESMEYADALLLARGDANMMLESLSQARHPLYPKNDPICAASEVTAARLGMAMLMRCGQMTIIGATTSAISIEAIAAIGAINLIRLFVALM